jgi:hypothetical protein
MGIVVQDVNSVLIPDIGHHYDDAGPVPVRPRQRPLQNLARSETATVNDDNSDAASATLQSRPTYTGIEIQDSILTGPQGCYRSC